MKKALTELSHEEIKNLVINNTNIRDEIYCFHYRNTIAEIDKMLYGKCPCYYVFGNDKYNELNIDSEQMGMLETWLNEIQRLHSWFSGYDEYIIRSYITAQKIYNSDPEAQTEDWYNENVVIGKYDAETVIYKSFEQLFHIHNTDEEIEIFLHMISEKYKGRNLVIGLDTWKVFEVIPAVYIPKREERIF